MQSVVSYFISLKFHQNCTTQTAWKFLSISILIKLNWLYFWQSVKQINNWSNFIFQPSTCFHLGSHGKGLRVRIVFIPNNSTDTVEDSLGVWREPEVWLNHYSFTHKVFTVLKMYQLWEIFSIAHCLSMRILHWHLCWELTINIDWYIFIVYIF